MQREDPVACGQEDWPQHSKRGECLVLQLPGPVGSIWGWKGRDVEPLGKEPEAVGATRGREATQLQAKEVGPCFPWPLGC